MPIYICKIVDRDGKRRELVREAQSEEILVRELSKEELYPINVRKTAEKNAGLKARKRYSRASILEFTNTISLLLSSGLSLRDALEVAQTIFLKGDVNEMVVVLLEELQKGKSVYNSLKDFESSFPPIFNGFVKIGEKLGSLEGSFSRLSEYMSREQELKNKLSTSLIYPVLVLTVAIVGIGAISLFVIPRIRDIFLQIGSQLSKRLETMVRFLNIALGCVIAFLVIGTIAAVAFIVLKRGRKSAALSLDRILLRIPIYGRLKYIKECLNFLYAMETLTEGGYTVEDALIESSAVVSNLAFRTAILNARDRVLKGEDLSRAMFDEPVFAERIARWVAIGERSGNIGSVFQQLSRYYQGELERWTSRFMSLIEPVLILFVGGIIFFIIVFFITPIFSVYEELF